MSEIIGTALRAVQEILNWICKTITLSDNLNTHQTKRHCSGLEGFENVKKKKGTLRNKISVIFQIQNKKQHIHPIHTSSFSVNREWQPTGISLWACKKCKKFQINKWKVELFQLLSKITVSASQDSGDFTVRARFEHGNNPIPTPQESIKFHLISPKEINRIQQRKIECDQLQSTFYSTDRKEIQLPTALFCLSERCSWFWMKLQPVQVYLSNSFQKKLDDLGCLSVLLQIFPTVSTLHKALSILKWRRASSWPMVNDNRVSIPV